MPNPQCQQLSLVLTQFLEKQRQEEDQLLLVFNQHLREALQENRSRNTFALFSAVENVSEVIEQKDNELVFANMKAQELHGNLQRTTQSRDFWKRIAMEKMQTIADLQTTLDNTATPAPCFSSTLPQSRQAEVGDSSHSSPFMLCKLCDLTACMVFLPCRHLCVCMLCDFTVNECPICNAEKVQSIEVLFGNE